MSDPKRIDELVELLRRVWSQAPDQRLGQLIVNAARPARPVPEVFQLEDSELRKALLQLAHAESEGRSPPSAADAQLSWEDVVAPAASTVTLNGARVATFEVGELFCQVIEVRFAGEYRSGSAGTPDADAMALALAGLLLRTEPDAVLLDLSRLRYTWGDGMVRVLETIDRFDRDYPVGTVILAGPESQGALMSLGAKVYMDPKEALEAVKTRAVKRSADIG